MNDKTARRGRSGKQGNAVGRPRVTLSDLHPNWKTIMHLLYQEGGTDIEVRCALAIAPSMAMSDDLWYGLIEREPEFSRAVKEGQMLAEAWWVRQGRQGLNTYEGVKFNTTLWIVNMRNRFNFKGADRNAAPGEDKPEGVQFYIPDNRREKQTS